MNGVGLGISGDDLQQIIGELWRGAVGRHFGKVPPRFGLHAAERVGRAAAPILGSLHQTSKTYVKLVWVRLIRFPTAKFPKAFADRCGRYFKRPA